MRFRSSMVGVKTNALERNMDIIEERLYRKKAMEIAADLPTDKNDALIVLKLAADLVTGFMSEGEQQDTRCQQ